MSPLDAVFFAESRLVIFTSYDPLEVIASKKGHFDCITFVFVEDSDHPQGRRKLHLVGDFCL